MGVLETILPTVFALIAAAYLGVAIFVSRSSPGSIIGYFLFLIGMLVAGSAFSYGTTDPQLFGIGRTLTFFAAGFLPVAFYTIYRQYTTGLPGPVLIVLLSLIPLATTLLAATNSAHNLIWDTVSTAQGIEFTDVTDHFWFNRVHGPFAYGLFGFSVFAMALRQSSIAPAHRRTIRILVACALIPYCVSVANTLLGIGPIDFPFLSTSLVLMFPLYAYAAVTLRVYDFSPVEYQTLFDHVRDPIIVLDTRKRVICANRKATDMLGRRERELIGRQLWEEVPEARAILEKSGDVDLTQTLELDGRHTYEVNVAPLVDSNGKQQGTVVVCRDVTERRKALSALADSEHLVRTLIETSSNGILRFARSADDEPLRCIFANRAAESHLGGDRESVVGVPLMALAQLDPEKIVAHFDDSDAQASPISFELPVGGGEGEENWLRVVAEPVGQDISLTLIDITQRKLDERKMLADALRDPLTGVLNRRGFEKEAARCIRSSSQGAVLYLDLNQFKSINDRFGHQAGDALLKAFGHRLEFCLRPEDVLGRLGGDEFAIVLPGVSVEDVKHIAERLVANASEAYIIQGKEITCAASVGIALIPTHGQELWHLISAADEAMYHTKNIAEDVAANDRAAYVEAAMAREH